jgi:hypothetical protein
MRQLTPFCWLSAFVRMPFDGGDRNGDSTRRMAHIHEKIDFADQHIGMIYWARPLRGSVRLAEAEHHAIRWCRREELDQLVPELSEAVKWYCCKAMEEVGSSTP